jgi:hypothetical protein
MPRIVVLLVVMLGVARADDAAPVTLGQAGMERAPGTAGYATSMSGP